jgi:hypothetical protein
LGLPRGPAGSTWVSDASAAGHHDGALRSPYGAPKRAWLSQKQRGHRHVLFGHRHTHVCPLDERLGLPRGPAGSTWVSDASAAGHHDGALRSPYGALKRAWLSQKQRGHRHVLFGHRHTHVCQAWFRTSVQTCSFFCVRRVTRKPAKATSEIRERLGIPRNAGGTAVTIHVRETIRCPQLQNMREKTQTHYQLRDIMRDPPREVVLVNASRPDEKYRLHYGIDTDALKAVLTADLAIPDYPGVSASLRLWRLPEGLPERPSSDPYRPQGVLIAGDRAAYENSLFSFESNPYAQRFTGRLECTYIEGLIRDFDDRRATGRSQRGGLRSSSYWRTSRTCCRRTRTRSRTRRTSTLTGTKKRASFASICMPTFGRPFA